MKNRRVAVTGGTGFLGSYLLPALVEEGYEPLVLSTKERPFSFPLKKTDYGVESLAKCLEGCSAVIHLAAKRGGQPRIEEYHSGEILTQNVLEAAGRVGAEHVLLASSISVYSDQDLLPWREDQAARPVNMYGISKLAAEYIGHWSSEKYGLYVKSLRLAHLFGAMEKNNYMINLFMRKAYLKKKLTVKESAGKREFLYAKEAASAFIRLLDQDFSGSLNIGSGQALSNLEVAEAINEVFGNAGNLELTGWDEGIRSSYFSSERAKKMFGYQSRYSFSQALEEIKQVMGNADVQEFY